jgi:two-component system, OmpR family, alkaline phosphatase synthesis response regulator PhoP
VSKRVLIIEDDTAICQVVQISLKKFGGYDVLNALSGKEGLAIAEREHPDAIVLDLGMPGMDGFEVLKRLQANPLTQFIPVVMLTANTSQVNRQAVAPVGMVGIISKPFDVLTLSGQIAAACGWT